MPVHTKTLVFATLLASITILQSHDSAAYDDFMDDLEDAVKDPSDNKILTDKDFELYDENGNGKLDHKEMAKYLKDALEIAKRKVKQVEATQDKNIPRLNSLHLCIVLILTGATITIIATAILKRAHARDVDRKEPSAEDIRAARLRSLGYHSNSDTSLNNSQRATQSTPTSPQSPSTRVTQAITDSRSEESKSKEKTELRKRVINPKVVQRSVESFAMRKEPNYETVAAKRTVSQSKADSVLEKPAASNTKVASSQTSEKQSTGIEKAELTLEETVQLTLNKILQISVNVDSSGSSPKSSSMVIKRNELPENQAEIPKKVEKLLSKALHLELDPLRSALKCYDACQCLPPDFKGKASQEHVWGSVTAVAKNTCFHTVKKQLIHEDVEDDLWEGFKKTSLHPQQDVSLCFLGCLSGWSPDGVSVSPELLSRLLEEGHNNKSTRETFREMIICAGRYVNSIERLDEVAIQCSSVLKGVEALLKQPQMVQFIAKWLEEETDRKEPTEYFQKSSIFALFLSLTSLEMRINGKSRASLPFKELPHFPRPFKTDSDRVQSQILDALHSCQNIVYKALRAVLTKHHESAMSWLSAVITYMDMRTVLTLGQDEAVVATDGYMMNLCSVLLQFCEPFFVVKGTNKIVDIQSGYPVSKACRLDYSEERTMTGLHLGEEGEERQQQKYKLSEDLRGQFNLKSEMFHLTHRALHIGLTNTLQHYSRLLRKYASLKDVVQGKENSSHVEALLTLFVCQWNTVIEDLLFVHMCSEFYITTAAWITRHVEEVDTKNPEDQIAADARCREFLSSLPEFYIKDMCLWFKFMAMHNSQALKGLNVYVFVNCVAILMNNRVCVPGPMVASKIVSALLAFAECCSSKREKEHLLETASWGSGVEGDLTACVVTCQAIKAKLIPALTHTYTSVDVVEGLDVDKEEFDKFGTRVEVVRLLQFLWTDPEHGRDSLKSECGKESFQGFLNAILDSLMYLLSDGLSRVAHVAKLQRSHKEEENPDSLDLQDQEKAQFLRNEEHVSKSFMHAATATLDFLAIITEEENVARCFLRSPITQRTASAIIGFLDSLVGPKSLDLKVKNMEKYSFNPRDLLVKLISILLHISNSAAAEGEPLFARCITADPDYIRDNLQRALRILKREGLVAEDTLVSLRSFVVKCDEIQEAETAGPISRSADSSAESPEQTPSTGDGQVTHSANYPSEASGTPVDETAASSRDEEENGGSAQEGATTVTQEGREEIYIVALQDARYDTMDLLDYTAFQSCRAQPPCQRSGTIKALMHEVTQLRCSLPIHPNSSVFVRQDENRMDFARALVTGPVDTPYSRGCFVFDIFFPGTYPNVPPLVKLITTGNGTVRFNPNLYADGKVCLSLLGTWYGGVASEKWDPKKSSLYQVLLSIQGMILIPDPCFNEPGYEGIRNTDEGEILSREYNAAIRLATVRHAMTGQLRSPPAGLGNIIMSHFLLQKDDILQQCADWLRQCVTPDEERRLRRAVEELKTELDKL
ncbi:uncharacterized protein LOC5513359 isoform X2 [Nematostella vectensis]|uniref:uncharacterized protein LOC5513359 isoform X2 n=1 Tax=Nematostella vectensis TaxID=45351 RepID=UPI0020771279|nr:uncharacterized protein LOC5513359 isoform X2 [Nematostella vectensis]